MDDKFKLKWVPLKSMKDKPKFLKTSNIQTKFKDRSGTTYTIWNVDGDYYVVGGRGNNTEMFVIPVKLIEPQKQVWGETQTPLSFILAQKLESCTDGSVAGLNSLQGFFDNFLRAIGLNMFGKKLNR